MPDPAAPPAPPVSTTSSIPAEGPTGPIQTISGPEKTVTSPTVEKKSAPATPARPEPRVVSAREVLGLDRKPAKPEEKPRDEGGKFVPKSPAAVKAKVKPVAKVEPTAPPVVAPPVEPVAPAAPKFKVGDKEMTSEEVAAHIAALEKRALDAAKPLEPKPEVVKPEPVAAKTPEQIATEEKARENEFIAGFVEKHGITQEAADRMLSTGDFKPLNEALARVAMDLRKFAADAVNPAIEEVRSSMRPLLSREEQVAQWQAEEAFLSIPENAELAKAGQAGRVAIREASVILHRHYDLLQLAISTGRASPEQVRMAEEMVKPDQWNSDLAYHAKNLIRSNAPAAITTAVPTPTPVVAKPRPEPPGGQPTGAGGGDPVSSQRSVMNRISHTR